MKITATVENSFNKNIIKVQTNDVAQKLTIPSKPAGLASSVYGGELLCLALATCFCNDIYREARKKSINVTKVSVEARAEFSAEGERGHAIQYTAKVEGNAPDEALAELIRHTDQVAEIQNTLRSGVEVTLLQ